MKKVVIVPDSFKGTMSSIEVCDIIDKAVKKVIREVNTVKIPVADGGEGTVDAFLYAVGGERIEVTVKDPYFRDIQSFYGILPDGKTAVIEMAAASGLSFVEGEENPCLTSTYGTGQLIMDALKRGCTKIITGIGGSATNDGGIGMAAALGVRFLDCNGREVPLNGEGMGHVERIDMSSRDLRVSECTITAACDVDNPFYGKNGAAYIFAPQKGANDEMVKLLDDNLKHLAGIIDRDLGVKVQRIPGSGAAGGLGGGLIAFAGAKLQQGIKIILDAVHFDEIITDADLIITGEGKIDGQSLRGKVPVGIALRAKKKDIPVIAVVGNAGRDIEKVYENGISAVFSTNRIAAAYKDVRPLCREFLFQTVEDIMRFASVIDK